MHKRIHKQSPVFWISLPLILIIVMAYIGLSSDAFIDVGSVESMAQNDVSLYSQQRLRKESGNVVSGVFQDQQDVAGLVKEDEESNVTTNTPTDIVTPDNTDQTTSITDGDVIDLTSLVGSTQHVISKASGQEKDTTISGFSWTYMKWYLISSKSSNQFKLREKYYPGWGTTTGSKGKGVRENEVAEAFDGNGFAKIDGRYVVAVTLMDDGGIGRVGQMLDVYLGDGSVVKCVVGDIKSDSTGEWWCSFGHMIDDDTHISVIEFVVSASFMDARNTPLKCLPSLNSGIVKIVRGGSLL